MNHRHQSADTRRRRLLIEPLEDRRILDAAGGHEVVAVPLAEEAPWRNPIYRWDVNNDSVVTQNDILLVINRILLEGTGELPTPTEPVTTFYDTDGNNRVNTSDILGIINALLAPPASVQTSTMATFTVDVTPQVTVTATPGTFGDLPNGTPVYLDVDLNNDGDFNDPGEFGRTESTLYNGKSTFSLTPALARSTELYQVNLRARVKDSEGIIGRSEVIPLVVDTLTSDALKNYVNTPDPTYSFQIRDTLTRTLPGVGSYTRYAIDMTSQTWRSAADVDKPVWRHWLMMYVPAGQVTNTGILLINGGSNNNFVTPPDTIDLLGQASILLGSVFLDLRVVPNEPVMFTDENFTRTEDDIIAYSFDKFLEHGGEEGNDTWPVLVAMVKSAVRAMDTAQDVLPSVKFGANLSQFVVTGYSKRGWTTWLTAAVDERVKAILPGVFDNLNQGPQMVHHYGVYNFFSQAVQPYNEMEIFHRILTPEALPLSRIVDPYTYLANGRFDNMPKLIINSSGDEFFVSDSAQFYFDDIPGEQNYLLYIPNTGHGLDINLNNPSPQESRVASATITFVDAVLNNRTLPKYSWTVGQDGAIRVETDTTPLEVKLWQVTNPVARDFRRAAFPNLTWTATTLSPVSPGVYLGDVAMPAAGARAYFVELTYANSHPSGNPWLSEPFVFTTEIRVKSTLPIYPWPFESAFEPLAAPAVAANSAGNDPTLNAAASALVLERQTDELFELDDEVATELVALPLAAQPDLAEVDVPLLLSEELDEKSTLLNEVDDEVSETLIETALASLTG
jgi:PhoPQ-activated pathogenicity-related protein